MAMVRVQARLDGKIVSVSCENDRQAEAREALSDLQRRKAGREEVVAVQRRFAAPRGHALTSEQRCICGVLRSRQLTSDSQARHASRLQLDNVEFQAYMRYLHLRHRGHAPRPHTKLAAAETAVLQEFHFCNCRRRDNPGGQWLIARLSQQVDILDVLRNAILFAVIPKPSTFAYLAGRLGGPAEVFSCDSLCANLGDPASSVFQARYLGGLAIPISCQQGLIQGQADREPFACAASTWVVYTCKARRYPDKRARGKSAVEILAADYAGLGRFLSCHALSLVAEARPSAGLFCPAHWTEVGTNTARALARLFSRGAVWVRRAWGVGGGRAWTRAAGHALEPLKQCFTLKHFDIDSFATLPK